MAHIQPENLQNVQKIRFRQKVLGLTGLIWWSRTLKVPAVNQSLACVASVSVEQRAKNGVFGVLSARKTGREQKQDGEGWGRGRKRLFFLSFLPPPPSFLFLLSPHFSLGQNAENPVLRSLLHGDVFYTG